MRDVISRPIQALWGGKAQKINTVTAIQNMLEMISEAAIVYDNDQNKVLNANSAFLVLSAYSLQEVVNAPLEELFTLLDWTRLNQGDPQSSMLKLRNRPEMPVNLRATVIDPVSSWRVIRVTSQTESQMSSGRWFEKIMGVLQVLPDLVRENDLENSLKKITQISHDLFDTNLVCIYHANSQIPELQKLVTLEELTFFPETLPSTDLIRLSSANLWMPGRRMTTTLHRSARVGGLSYVATVPLGSDKAMDGIFVIGGIDTQPPPLLLNICEILGYYTGLAFEQAIRSQNQELMEGTQYRQGIIQASIYENINEGVLVLKPDLMIDEINPAAELLFGYTNNEVKGQRVENILITPDRLMPVLTGATTGITTPNMESITLHSRAGQAFTADVKVIPILREDEVLAINVMVRDISEHEQILTQTRQLEQRALLGEFMGVFAHEVLNPINNISMGLQNLTKRLGDENPHQDMITRMENDCQRLHHQMEALKNFAKPYEPLQEPVEIGGLLKRILERWRPRMERLGINQVYQPPESLPPVKGDWRALEQVFTNLVSNAIDAMRDSGGILSVRVAVSTPASNRPQVEVAVSDNGPGIPDEIRDRLFEPFVTTKSMGTGLGLPITKRIITAHRGSITYNSIPGGTVFHVILPACEEEPECR